MFCYLNKVGNDIVHLEVGEDMVEILLMLQVLFSYNSAVENWLFGTASFSKASPIFGDAVLHLKLD